MQFINRIIIRNKDCNPIVDEVAKAFISYAIYSIGDLYLDYNQFQLAIENKNLTTMKTLLDLIQMYTLSQSTTNSIAYM